jgi:lipoate-protein ligase A
MRQWRLIYDHPMPGAVNMAVDEALLEAVGAGQSSPTLRFYAWEPACLSLGYGQASADADAERLRALGWQSVRRPTGGRAILHTDELTYSLALPADHPLAAGDVVVSYQRISQALLVGLEQLGAAAHSDLQTEKRTSGPICFEVPSHYEITVKGRKLIGSAQVRRHKGVLQHGSLPLHGDLGRIADALVFPDESEREAARAAVRARAITLEAALGAQVVTWARAADSMQQAFASLFEVELVSGTLTTSEQARADELYVSRYGNMDWTTRR